MLASTLRKSEARRLKADQNISSNPIHLFYKEFHLFIIGTKPDGIRIFNRV
jgi:hypothetical protein